MLTRIVVHTPVHASWLNQVEIYFSIVQRKVLTPNDFASLEDVEQRLRLYEELSNRQPRPFEWKFTRAKLVEFLKRLEAHGVIIDQGNQAQEAPEIASARRTLGCVTLQIFMKRSTKAAQCRLQIWI